MEYRLGDRTALGPSELRQWAVYDDPRRRPGDTPSVSTTTDGLRIAGTGWPGITTDYPAAPGAAYLVRVTVSGARDGDLLYLGTWRERQTQSLVGSSSSGVPAALIPQPWFPSDRAFVEIGPRVQMLIYSEAPRTAFEISALDVYRLRPRAGDRR